MKFLLGQRLFFVQLELFRIQETTKKIKKKKKKKNRKKNELNKINSFLRKLNILNDIIIINY